MSPTSASSTARLAAGRPTPQAPEIDFETARVSVILASIDARETIRQSVAAFLEEVGDRGEVIVVDASRDGSADEVERLFPEVKVLRRDPGQLAPVLWRDGLLEANSPLVAFSTAQMVPSPGWLDGHLRCMADTGAAGVGGPIEASYPLPPVDRAIYLLRYVNYGYPMARSDKAEPPGDNAFYRREALLGVAETWSNGFWEVEVHRGLRSQGSRLELTDDATVEFRGGSRLSGLIRQRGLHARYYGASRAGQMGPAQRLLRILTAPAVPLVLLRRIASALNVRKRSLVPWLPALPSLGILLTAWTSGEVMGTMFGAPTSTPACRDAVGFLEG
ncbi:glycosyltransferase [Singulisphaera sp. PoT]|uniref:glycosyltransferase n=1 Tax=Singulisphaera sp. PoT TaxID=3411797 RepID=UPI003BF4E499